MRARRVGVAVVILALSACGSGAGSAEVSEPVSPSPGLVASATPSPEASLLSMGAITEVTGTDDCALDPGNVVSTEGGVWRWRDGTATCTTKASDPRIEGTGTGTWNHDVWQSPDPQDQEQGALVEWGTTVTENAGGTWVGTYTGVAISTTGDLITAWSVGTGDYKGLSYFQWEEVPSQTGSMVGTFHGLIFPGKPPTP
jgi:hypothetical protein